MQNEFEQTNCLICEANDYTTFSTKGQFGLPTHVVICKACGFSYLNPRWTKERYDRFYTKEYDYYYRPEIIGQNDELYRYKSIENILARSEENGIKISFENVLDIGAGMGHALIYIKNKLKPNGIFEAIEPSENCKVYMAKNGINHISSDVYSDWHKNNSTKYDFIIMRHVLEHFHEPLTVLQKAHEAVKDDGYLYIAVPDAFHPTKPLRSHFFRIVHISYFSKNSFLNLLKKAGLEAIAISEGDSHDKNEVFAFCRKTSPSGFIPDASQYGIQKAVYEKFGKTDFYYSAKRILISILRKLKIIK